MRFFIYLLVIIGCVACTPVSAPGGTSTKPETGDSESIGKSGTQPEDASSKTGGPSTSSAPAKTASSTSNEKSSDPNKPGKDPETYRKTIEEIAAKMDNTVEDGWFFGEEPRMFKSFYRKISPAQKAEFSMAYHDFISRFNQNLVNDYKTYVPYSKRADFAFDWWSKKEPRFNKSELKMQVLWAHESIQDAGELFWRASEKLEKEPTDSIRLMAHDEEQRMVSHFTEVEGSPGSISDQVWKREHI